MTRTEAIAVINAKLAALDDARVITVAAMIDGLGIDATAVRPLTAREVALLEQSKEDFAAGRTYSVDGVSAPSDGHILPVVRPQFS